MLAVPADRLPTALADLDPGNRALLDLSLRRGVSDAEIGELLRKDPADVARGRDAVLELLADTLEVNGEDRRERVRRAILELPDDAWRAPASAEPEPEAAVEESVIEESEPEPELESEPEAEPEPEPEPEPIREDEPEPAATPLRERVPFEPDDTAPGRTGRLLAIVGLLIVVVVLAIVLIGGGDDDSKQTAGKSQPSEPAPQPSGKQSHATLRAFGGGKVTGDAVARGNTLVLTVRHLPSTNGTYQAWLYNNIVDAERLGSFQGGNRRITFRLPADVGKYRYLDVSREPSDGNPNHSGATVLRVRLAKLRG